MINVPRTRYSTDEERLQARRAVGKRSYSKRAAAGKIKPRKKERTDVTRAKEAEWRKANRELIRESSRVWNAANRDKVKSYSLVRKFGITIEEYRVLEKTQDGLCQICKRNGKDVDGKHLAVDHCHVTKKVRGLLCYSCNIFIGIAEEDRERLLAAVAYLEAHRDA